MALTAGQRRAQATLQQRQAAGTIGQRGLARLDALRAQQAAKGTQAGNVFNTQAGAQYKPTTPAPGAAPGAGGGVQGGVTTTPNPGDKIVEKTKDATGMSMEEFGQQFDPTMEKAFNPLDFGALPAAPNTQDLAGERARIEGTLYDKFTRDFDTERAQATAAFEQAMAEKGISPGSGELYENERNRFDRQWDRRYDEAKQNAVAQGLSEQQGMFNMGQEGRATALSEQITDRQFPMQQLTGLLGLGTQAGGQALSYKQLQNNKKIALQQIDAQLAIARMNNDTSRANALLSYKAQVENSDIDLDPGFDEAVG